MPLIRQLITDVHELERWTEPWSRLLARSATNEPALSPAWLLEWWRVFGREGGRSLRVLLFFERGEERRLVGLAPFLARRAWYRPGLPFRRLELLGTGERPADAICSDYLGVVAERGFEAPVASGLADALGRGELGPWDECVMANMAGDGLFPTLLCEGLRQRGLSARAEVTGGAPYIPLPATWDAYLAALPSSHRYVVRRSLRDFEVWAGDTARFETVEAPADLRRGSEVLLALHDERWSEQDGRGGVFGSVRFRRFHDALMPRLLEAGALDLTWLSVRGEPVVAHYNFVWDRKVQFYQSGRKLNLPPEVRVGIVMHAHAIRRAIEGGMREYDFLAGVSRYKRELSLATRPLVRIRVVRQTLREIARQTVDGVVERARLIRDARRARKSAP